MPFLIFFYLTVVCNLATFSSAGGEADNQIRSSAGCHTVSPIAVSCQHTTVTEVQFHANITKLELINVPLAVLNEDLIPKAIQSDLLDLRHLTWTSSHIKDLESVSIPNLEELDLSWNIIRDVQSNAFSQLTRLKTLNISRNNIEQLPSNVFEKCSSLAVLSVSHNQLETLPSGIFDALTKLEILDLSNNRLAHLEDTLFTYNLNLTNLNLGYNRLSSLPSALFQPTSTLQSLSLHNNSLVQVPYSIVDTQLEHLSLDGNPWPCDCSVQWIPLWAHNANNSEGSLLQLGGYCNGTSEDLLHSLHEMRCKPTIVRVSTFSYHTLDEKVHLVCRVYANPAPSVGWFTPTAFVHSDQPSPSGSTNPTVRPLENGDLQIGQMSRDDAGEYVCTATNQVGKTSAHARLYIDPSIFRRIKTGSVICGLLCVHTFLVFSILYLMIRRCCGRTKYDLRMQESMDAYKLQQLTTLKEDCHNQMDRIKNSCSDQVSWIKEKHQQAVSTAQLDGISCITNQHNNQMAEIRECCLTQLHQVREHYRQQLNLIREYSLNLAPSSDSANDPATPFVPADIGLVKMEDGTASPEDDDEDQEIYKCNDTLKDEIRALTSSYQIPGHATDGEMPTTSFHDHISDRNLPATAQDQDEDETTSMLPCTR